MEAEEFTTIPSRKSKTNHRTDTLAGVYPAPWFVLFATQRRDMGPHPRVYTSLFVARIIMRPSYNPSVDVCTSDRTCKVPLHNRAILSEARLEALSQKRG